MEPIYCLHALFVPCVLLDTLWNRNETDTLYVLWCSFGETAFAAGQLQIERVVYSIFAVCLFLAVPVLVHTPQEDFDEETARILDIFKDPSFLKKIRHFVAEHILGRSSDPPDEINIHLGPHTKEEIIKTFADYKLGCGICDLNNWEHRTFLQDWAANVCMYTREALQVFRDAGYQDRSDIENSFFTFSCNILQPNVLRSWFKMFSTVDKSFRLFTEDVIEQVLPKHRLIVKEIFVDVITKSFSGDNCPNAVVPQDTDYLYHYSDNVWMIWQTKRLLPSIEPKDSKFGKGVYFTAIQNTEKIRSAIRSNNYDGKPNEAKRHSIWKVQHCIKIPKRLIPGVQQKVHPNHPERDIWILPTEEPFNLPAEAQLETFYRNVWNPMIVRMVNAPGTPIQDLIIIFLVHAFTGSFIHLICYGCFRQIFII